MDAQASSGVQSLDRIFSIIEELSNYPKGLALTELCAITQLPKGTVSRMLGSLITHGYAVQEPESKKYRLTMRLFEIGCRVAGRMNLLSVARPYLESLSNVTEEAVHLVTRSEDEVVYLYKEEPVQSVVRMSSFVGLRIPMYCTGVGKSILAFLPDAEIRAIWERNPPVRFTPKTIVSLDAMMEEIARIRAVGYAIDEEEHEIGVRCIAAPILDFSGTPVAAISISAPVTRMTEEKLREYAGLLLDSARNIRRYFGK